MGGAVCVCCGPSPPAREGRGRDWAAATGWVTAVYRRKKVREGRMEEDEVEGEGGSELSILYSST